MEWGFIISSPHLSIPAQHTEKVSESSFPTQQSPMSQLHPSWLTWKKVTAFCAIPGERTLLDSTFDDGCITQFLSLGTLSVSSSHDSYMSVLITIMVCSFDSLVSDTFRLCDLEQAGTVSRADIPYYVHSEIYHSEISDILHTCTFSDLKT